MKAIEHPSYNEETKQLSSVVEILEKKIEKENPYNVDPDKYWEVYGGADEHTALVFRMRAIAQWDEFKRVLLDPYFGRIDFSDDDLKPETWYIGYCGIQVEGCRVIDWRAPAGALFYKSTYAPDGKQSYFSPSGVIHGKLLLKRHLKIYQSILQEISDELDFRNVEFKQKQLTTSDEILAKELYTRGDPRLQDIVKTIQEHQDRIIRAKANTALLINGVAGSGKTSIGYHRIAYLLYPDTKSGIKPGETIAFGPNRFFVNYVKELLPSLGAQNINQVSFDDWALEQANLIERQIRGNEIEYRRRFEIQEASLQAFLDHRILRDARISHWKRARLKGSKKIQMLLENYASWYKSRIVIPDCDLTLSNLGQENIRLVLKKNDLQKIYHDVLTLNLPFAKLRDRLLVNLRDFLSEEYEKNVLGEYDVRISQSISKEMVDRATQFRNRALSIPSIKREVVDQAFLYIDQEMKKYFPLVDLRNDYYRLLSNPELLTELGKGFLSEEETRLLSSLSVPNNKIDVEDIPALLYFHILTFGKNGTSYSHILIDEAQDFSPLQFSILRLYSRNGSMTILGDIAQGIFAHRGISDWSEIRSIFHKDSFSYEEISQNYRSTREIVEFTNEVLKSTRKGKYSLPKPFNRIGEKPLIIEAVSRDMMYARLDADIYALIVKDIHNIGIIVKTETECDEVMHYLEKNKIYNISKINARDFDYEYKGGIVVIPIALAKGIEFQAAMIINADESHFDGNVEYDGRLLYVAVTRALHSLNVYAVGKVSRFIATAKHKAKYQTL